MNTLSGFGTIPTVAEIEQIAAHRDPVIRNLQITQSYHELAQIMAVRTGVCANWCTFATWASKQAGQTIRKQDLIRALENLAFSAQSEPAIIAAAQGLGSRRSPLEMGMLINEALNPARALARASEAVSRGNQKVYQEIAREFARFYAICLHDTEFHASHLEQFCQAFRPGNPPHGQSYLRQAFTVYYRAFFEPDPKTRAELIFFGNILIGYHEQTRLQPEIAEALNAALVDRQRLRLRLVFGLFPRGGWWVWSRLFFMRLFRRPSPFDQVVERLIGTAREQLRQVITRYLMMLELPRGVVVRLGEDLPGEFPPTLCEIAHQELADLLATLDPTPNSTGESRAVDWSHLPDRLHFIVDLFRRYHETGDLFDPPFTDEQVNALKSERLPGGRL